MDNIKKNPDSTMCIWVLSDHWCIIGTKVTESDREVLVDNASVIRKWGTDAGIGQLALEGCRKETILDKQPRTTIQKSRVTFTLECDPIWTPEHIAGHLVNQAMS